MNNKKVLSSKSTNQYKLILNTLNVFNDSVLFQASKQIQTYQTYHKSIQNNSPSDTIDLFKEWTKL